MHLLLAISKSSFTTMSVISLELTIEEKKQRTTKQEPTVVNDIGSICQGKRKKLYFKLKKIKNNNNNDHEVDVSIIIII